MALTSDKCLTNILNLSQWKPAPGHIFALSSRQKYYLASRFLNVQVRDADWRCVLYSLTLETPSWWIQGFYKSPKAVKGSELLLCDQSDPSVVYLTPGTLCWAAGWSFAVFRRLEEVDVWWSWGLAEDLASKLILIFLSPFSLCSGIRAQSSLCFPHSSCSHFSFPLELAPLLFWHHSSVTLWCLGLCSGVQLSLLWSSSSGPVLSIQWASVPHSFWASLDNGL